MDFSAFEENVIAVMEEQQIKLGSDGNPVYLFYPLISAAGLLGVRAEEDAVSAALKAFCKDVYERLGGVEYQLHDGRITLVIPPEGCEYVKAHLQDDSFIVRLIRMIAAHAHMQDVIDLFNTCSARVHIEKMPEGEEFDYLLYFEDGKPDAFYYCLKEDMGHVTYHRFTKADYEAFGF